MIKVARIKIADKLFIGGKDKFVLIAGPCAIESAAMAFDTAAAIRELCLELNIPLVFKSSFDKANRSSLHSARGVGMEKGLTVLQEIKDKLGLPVLTDVHESGQCAPVAEVVDVLQIPAFLSRQTDLLLAAAQTGKVVNIKKGQFMAPWDMRNVITKMEEAGNKQILLCERGSCFGYNNLVVDMTGLTEMRSYGYPLVFDATHSVQKPGGLGNSSGGNREMVPPLIRAAMAVGVDGLFLEVHPDPDRAISDGPNQVRLDSLKSILQQAAALDKLVKNDLLALSVNE